MDSGDRILVAAGLTAAVVVGAFVFWGPGGAPRVRKRRGQISGLQNLGRTCFLNTMIQALAACPAFINWLKVSSKSTASNSMITTLYTVIEVVNGMHEQARGTPVCPLGVLQCLRAAGWVLPPEQHDAHELLHALLSCIEEEALTTQKKPGCLSDALGLGAWSTMNSPGTPPSASLSLPRPDSTPPTPTFCLPRPASALNTAEPELADPEPAPRLSKAVSRSFCHLSSVGRWALVSPPSIPSPPSPPPTRGTLALRLQCTACSHKSPVRYDKFDSVSLPLTNTSIGITGTFSLAGMLRAFTAPEIVKGVHCAKKCRDEAEGCQHIRSVGFGKLPSVLVLHIARVLWLEGRLAKRGERVAFPETLSLAPYVAHVGDNAAMPDALASADRCTYIVRAVVVHAGGAKSGHFATYRRGNGIDANRWWYTSDTLVHEVSLQEVLHSSAYMLFYERKRTGARGPLTSLADVK